MILIIGRCTRCGREFAALGDCWFCKHNADLTGTVEALPVKTESPDAMKTEFPGGFLLVNPPHPLDPDKVAAVTRVFANLDACRGCSYHTATPQHRCAVLMGDPYDGDEALCPGTIPFVDTLPIRRCCDSRCLPPGETGLKRGGACHHRNCINKTEPGCLCCDAAARIE